MFAKFAFVYGAVRLFALLAPAAAAMAQFTFSPIEIPGAESVFPRAINNNGDIAGMWGPGLNLFVLSASGVLTSFDAPGVGTYITGINDSGVVAGAAEADGSSVGFTGDRAGNLVTFALPANTLYLAGFNNAGETIVAIGEFINETTSNYIRDATGGLHPLPPFPSGYDGIYTNLNNNGQAVGNIQNGPAFSQGFVLDITSGEFDIFLYGAVAG